MNETNAQDSLAAAMAKEAAETSPGFSPLLHARIMRRITNAFETQDEASRFRIHRLAFGRWAIGGFAIGGTAAAILVITASVMFTLRHQPKRTVGSIARLPSRLPSFPPIADPVETFSKPVVNSFAEARFAYLDRDARNVMHYIADQVDVLPSTH